MAATYDHLKSTANRKLLDFDPDSGSAALVDLVPGSAAKAVPLSDGYGQFLFGIFRSVGTGTISAARVYVSDASDGTGNVTTVASWGLGSAPDAVGDTVWLEVNAEQIKKVALSTSLYLGVEITLQTSTDECVVYMERSKPRFAYDALTADFIS